ncbi:hypothetical protein Taro_031712, partial [Colocasia esculenta]|nr:hypothetical protein [Colocasia esculenta]
MGLQWCDLQVVVLVGLHCSLACACGPAVGPFGLDCETERGIIDLQSLQISYESYSRGMDERYGDDSQRPELDPDIWVAASGAPKKGHVYDFGHSLGTARVISSCSSSISHTTSLFTTPVAPGGILVPP